MTETPIKNGSYDLALDGSFLKDLPPSIKRYTYHGESQFFDILESESAYLEASASASEFLLFHASKETIETLVDPENELSPTTKYLSSFATDEELFLIRMPSITHGAAPLPMNDVIREAVRPMGLLNCLKGWVHGEIRGEFRGKQPDVAWGPRRTARGTPRSYSVILEVAYSENDRKLNSDVRFWLDPNNGKAEICLTLRIDRSQPEIRIEKWEKQNDHIYRSQAIWITKRGNQTCVSDHPLTISFESLFRRPSSCPRERDLEISEQQLKDVAERIWEDQCW